MLIYSFITDYQAFNLRYKDNTARDKNETKVGKQSANLGKNNEPIKNRLSFLIDCKSVILHHLTILSFPMVRPAWDNWWLLEFLRNCTPYEADSIRVMVGYGMGNGDIGTIEATDMLAVNRFLNHGLTKENGTSSEAVMKHRQERAQKLMEAVKGFVDISQLCRISVALMKISSDFKAVEDARGHLQSQSVANGNRN